MSDIALLRTLPEYSQSSTSRNASSTNIFMQPRRNPNLAKWKILFDAKGTEWISFKPKLGLQVYPCYACRNMFGSKNSFLDHVNRRAILLKYKCIYCVQQQEVWTFYNPCSFLLHTRQHYTLLGGQINLENLEVSVLPYGLAGFLPNPNISPLYDVDDDNIGESSFVNSRFYSPLNDCMGNPIVNLVPNELLFYYADESTREVTSLVLKQMSLNIPRCQFILHNSNNRPAATASGVDAIGKTLQPGDSYILSIKEEPQEPTPAVINAPIISKVASVEEPCVAPKKLGLKFTKCPECHQAQNETMSEHFLKTNQPFLQSLRCNTCKYIAPTKCSLQAHERIHESIAPFVCPECGRDFPHWRQLHEHMNEVCFHLTKQVRIRCSGKRCGKIFAQMSTFSSHFQLHLKSWLRCSLCDAIFLDEVDFFHHTIMTEHKEIPTKVFKCIACTDLEEIFTHETLLEHIHEHAVSKFLYVYICKRCHSYFRSPLTYATHLLRCTRITSPQINPNLIMNRPLASKEKYYCLVCKTEVVLQHLENVPSCSKCGSALKSTSANSDSSSELEQTFCPLCDQELMFSEIEEHTQNQCRYSQPVVVLKDCALSEAVHVKLEVASPKLDDYSNKKKRRKVTYMPHKNKNLSSSNSEPNLNSDFEEVVPFDGTYRCKLCAYTNEIREDFHKHIVNHRCIATAYQCMECGECFVVKPSLSKHLLFYHKISDVEDYFANNDCFDKKAIQELEDMMRLVPGETRGPVGENQCTVCLSQFSDNIELKKHFRVHGMAFILKNCM